MCHGLVEVHIIGLRLIDNRSLVDDRIIIKRKRKTFWNCMNKTISLNSEYIKIDGCIKIDAKPNIHFQMLK